MKWTDIATDLQEYVAMTRLLKKNRVMFDSGKGIQWNVMVDYVDSARNVGLYEPDSVSVGDGMEQADIPWRHTTANYAFDRREITMNASPAKIVDLIKTRRAQAMISLAAHCERDFWGKPTDSSDKKTPYGLKYWLVSNTSQGFNGGNPSGFSNGAGNLDSGTYPNWANYTDQYVDITKEDLVRKWRRAATFTKFMPPTDIPDYNRGDRYEFFTNYSVLGTIEELLEEQNDNLGNDVASKDGRAMFRKTPVQWAPYLENDTNDPIYGINWGVFSPVFLKGEYMREDGPQQAPNQHTVEVVYIDMTYNYINRDRRRGFVLTK
jgi:hypothetical protein